MLSLVSPLLYHHPWAQFSITSLVSKLLYVPICAQFSIATLVSPSSAKVFLVLSNLMSPETICWKLKFWQWLNVHSLVYCHRKKICDCFMTDKKWKTQHASREILFSYKNYSIQTSYHALKDLSCDNRVSTGCNLLWCNMKDLSQMQHFWQSDHLFETTTTIIKLFTVQFTLPQTLIIITLGCSYFPMLKMSCLIHRGAYLL